jgi:hypothetical protein
MSTHDPDDGGHNPDDYDDGPRRYGDEPNPDRLVADARGRVRIPGMLLILFGLFTIAGGAGLTVFSLTSAQAAIDWYYDWVDQMQKKNPNAQPVQLPPKQDMVRSLQVQGPVEGIIELVAGVFMVIGGVKMRSLSGYGWSVAGSVLAIFPGLCCCCVGLLPGIWGFVVLLGADVKRAFQLASRTEPPG